MSSRILRGELPDSFLLWFVVGSNTGPFAWYISTLSVNRVSVNQRSECDDPELQLKMPEECERCSRTLLSSCSDLTDSSTIAESTKVDFPVPSLTHKPRVRGFGN